MKRYLSGFSVFILMVLLYCPGNFIYGQQTTISPTPLYFGQITQGKEAFRILVIRNISAETLNISQIAIQGSDAVDFSVADNPGIINIAPFQRLELTLLFKPQSAGVKSAQVSITSNSVSSPDIISLNAVGTSPTGVVTFERVIGTVERDAASDVRLTADGGFILCGSTIDSLDLDFNDAYLVKTNSYGEVEWSVSFDSDFNDENSDGFSAVMPVSDGYIAVGNTENGSRDNDIWIVKTDLQGNFISDVLLGGTDDDVINAIEPTADGNFILAGYITDASGETKKNGYLVKIDSEGQVLWDSEIGGINAERFNSVKQTADNGFIVCGDISIGADSDMLLVKTNASGELTWDEQYGESGESSVDIAASVIVAADGGYVLAGRTTSSFSNGANDIYIVKTNADGVQDQTWGNKTFGEAHHDGASQIIMVSDGGYLVVGSLENHFEDNPGGIDWYADVYIIKLDQSGNKEWEKVYGNIREEGASAVRELADGSFVISGSTLSYGSSPADRDIFFLRINHQGNITAIEDNFPVIIPGKTRLAQNYPNPFNGLTTIKYSLNNNGVVQLHIYDINGRMIKTIVNTFQQAGDYRVSFNAQDLASGIYMYRLKAQDFTETKRFLLIK